MLYLKRQKKRKKKSGKKIFYVESNGQNGLHYLMLHSNVQKSEQNVYDIFLTWRPMPLKICGKNPQKSADCNGNAGRLEDRQVRESLSRSSLL